VRRALEHLDVPGEHEARVRSWEVVRAAFAEREPAPLRRRVLRPALALAALLAVVAAAASPPGRAVIGEVREAVGVERAAPALFSLPAEGRLLVAADSGVWVVHSDGGRRHLGRYREAAWSPFGRFVAAAGPNELAAVAPGGGVRWTLPRRAVSGVAWGGSQLDTRIAYRSGGDLRVVAGDGTGDRVLARGVQPVRPAWRPATFHVVAYVAADGRVTLADAVSGRRLWARRAGDVRRLRWSDDGELLLVQSTRALRVYGASGALRFDLLGPEAAPVSAAAIAPSGKSVAFVQQVGLRSELWVVPRLAPDASAARPVFSGAGRFSDVAWSPDGRWLLLAWRDADQWLFVRSAGVRRVEAVSTIAGQFRSRTFPSLEGWCCSSR
jgi:hypothetical protein